MLVQSRNLGKEHFWNHSSQCTECFPLQLQSHRGFKSWGEWQPSTKWNRLSNRSVIKARDTSAKGNAVYQNIKLLCKSFTKVCRLWLVAGLLFTQQKKVHKPQENLEKTSWEGHSNQHDWPGQENRHAELDMLSHPLSSARLLNPNPDFLNQYHLKKSSAKVRVTLWSQDF